ncbi:hypothetical protein HWI79_575 [Cryptosporidium felis]|nr:hypothetical protein HWI79_575 [Cryptosporidium felis]
MMNIQNYLLIIAYISIYLTGESQTQSEGFINEISLLRVKVKEKGFLNRAANAATRILFGVDTRPKEQPINTERIPVGLFPDPKALADELDKLENRKIVPDNNRQIGVRYMEDITKGETPNADLFSNSQMAQVSSGVFDRGSKEAEEALNKTSIENMKANKEREQALESQGQIIKEGESIKIGKPGPVTLNNPNEDKEGKTVPPKLAVVDQEEEFLNQEKKKSIFENPFVIIALFIVVICAFAGGALVYFKMFMKKKKRKK